MRDQKQTDIANVLKADSPVPKEKVEHFICDISLPIGLEELSGIATALNRVAKRYKQQCYMREHAEGGRKFLRMVRA